MRDKDHNLAWLFVQKWYPNYSSSDEIARNEDLLILLEEEDEEGSSARELLESYEWPDHKNPMIEEDFIRSCNEIYETALTAFVKANIQDYQ